LKRNADNQENEEVEGDSEKLSITQTDGSPSESSREQDGSESSSDSIPSNGNAEVTSKSEPSSEPEEDGLESLWDREEEERLLKQWGWSPDATFEAIPDEELDQVRTLLNEKRETTHPNTQSRLQALKRSVTQWQQKHFASSMGVVGSE
jgi:hypothetical protein